MVERKGTQKTRSHKQARGFRDTVTPENAPASAFLAFCLQKLGAKSPKVCDVRRKRGPKSQADRSVRKADSAGRLDRDVSTNKRLNELGFQGEGSRHLPAENMGIFCVSRIFGGDTGDDSTSLTCHLQSFLPLGRPFGFF